MGFLRDFIVVANFHPEPNIWSFTVFTTTSAGAITEYVAREV